MFKIVFIGHLKKIHLHEIYRKIVLFDWKTVNFHKKYKKTLAFVDDTSPQESYNTDKTSATSATSATSFSSFVDRVSVVAKLSLLDALCLSLTWAFNSAREIPNSSC